MVGGRAAAVQQSSTDPTARYFGADRANTGRYTQAANLAEAPFVTWEYDAGSSVNSSPVVVNQKTYFGTDAKQLYAVDVETGERQWRYKSGLQEHETNIGSRLSVLDGTVYSTFGQGLLDEETSGEVVALDAETGETQWTYETDTYFATSPVPSGSNVYVGDWTTGLYTLDKETGDRIWTLDSRGIDRTVPAVDGDTIFVRSSVEDCW